MICNCSHQYKRRQKQAAPGTTQPPHRQHQVPTRCQVMLTTSRKIYTTQLQEDLHLHSHRLHDRRACGQHTAYLKAFHHKAPHSCQSWASQDSATRNGVRHQELRCGCILCLLANLCVCPATPTYTVLTKLPESSTTQWHTQRTLPLHSATEDVPSKTSSRV